MTQRTILGATVVALAFSLAAGCKHKGSDAGTDAGGGGTDSGTDAGGGATDSGGGLPPDSGTTATLIINVTEVFNMPAGPIDAVVIDLFDRADVAETTSLASGTTDAAGNATLMVDVAGGPVNGYFKMTKATFKDTYHYDNYPTAVSALQDRPIVSMGTWGLFTGLTPSPMGADMGDGNYDAATESIGAFAIVDCTGTPVMGATLTTTSGSVRYQAGGFPTGTVSTDASGQVVVFELGMGPQTVSATLPATPAGCAGATADDVLDVRADSPVLGTILVP